MNWFEVNLSLVVYNDGKPVYIEPGAAYAFSAIGKTYVPVDPKYVTIFDPAERIKECKVVGIERSWALGDVLIALAGTRVLARAFPKIEWRFYSDRNLLSLIHGQDEVNVGCSINGMRPHGLDMFLSMHDFFEVDHGDLLPISRLNRMIGAFGLDPV